MTDLKVLLVEDSEQDAELILRELRKGGYSPESIRVQTRDEMQKALWRPWDIVLCDHSLPGFDSVEALSLVRGRDPNLPFIIVSGHIGEDAAVDAMRSGANDYIMKGNLKRLVPAIQRELREAQLKREREKTQKELKAKEEELRRREEELRVAREVEKLKDEFVGMVSHELKNPLTVIIGALRTAVDKRIPRKEAWGLIKDAIESADSLAAIIDNLLELSRSQNSRLALNLEDCDVAEIARKVVTKLEGKSSAHKLIVSAGDLPRVRGDPVRIERILYNLVDNAIKYSPEGGEVRVTLSTADGALVVAVSDQGLGISKEDQQRLFRHFERLGNYGGHVIEGTGLGLRVCQILTEAHGGRIWVDSEPGKGSTFFFSLPLNPSGTAS